MEEDADKTCYDGEQIPSGNVIRAFKTDADRVLSESQERTTVSETKPCSVQYHRCNYRPHSHSCQCRQHNSFDPFLVSPQTSSPDVVRRFVNPFQPDTCQSPCCPLPSFARLVSRFPFPRSPPSSLTRWLRLHRPLKRTYALFPLSSVPFLSVFPMYPRFASIFAALRPERHCALSSSALTVPRDRISALDECSHGTLHILVFRSTCDSP